jgi:hypothetical protein
MNIHLHSEICSKLQEKDILQLHSLWFSMQTSVLLGIAIAATMVLGVIPAYASQGNSDDSKNDFGEQASQNLAQDGEMGEHSSSQTEPRSGIGNVFNQGDPKDDEQDPIGEDPNGEEPDSKHPSDTANRLCGAFPDNSACN